MNMDLYVLDTSNMEPPGPVFIANKLSSYNIPFLYFIVVFAFVNIVATILHLLSFRKKSSEYTRSVLHSFSFIKNVNDIFKSSSTDNKLACLDGLRVLTLLWVMMHHHFIIAMSVFDYDDSYLRTWTQNPFNVLITSAVIANETLFVISGLLTGLTLVHQIKNPHLEESLPKTYLRRYLRLAPRLIAAVIIYATFPFSKIFGDISAVSYFKLFSTACQEHWLPTITLTQNYFFKDAICVPQSWHLAVEWQLFLVAPFFIRFLHVSRNKLTVIALAVLLPCCLTFYVNFQNNLFAGSISYKHVESNRFFQMLYIKTHLRAGPYFFGLGLSYYINKYSNVKLPNLKKYVTILWSISLSLLLFVLFLHQIQHYLVLNYETSSIWVSIFSAFHVGFSKVFWSIGISIIIFLCFQGHGGYLNRFLSHYIFTTLRKFSLSIFLTHIDIQYLLATFKNLNYEHSLIELSSMVGEIGTVLLVSFFGAVAIELPFVATGNLLLQNKSSKTTVKVLEENENNNNVVEKERLKEL